MTPPLRDNDNEGDTALIMTSPIGKSECTVNGPGIDELLNDVLIDTHT